MTFCFYFVDGFTRKNKVDFFITTGCAEQGQLGRVAECFSNRGGRKGLGRLLDFLFAISRLVNCLKKKSAYTIFLFICIG